VLAWMFEGEPNEGFIRDLFELRSVIEPAACAFAAERRTPEQLQKIADALGDMRRHGLSTPEGESADRRFHRAILAAAGNEALATLAGSVGAAAAWSTRFKRKGGTLVRDPLPDHIAVHDAIAAGDSDRARSAMTELLRLAVADMAQATLS
jgi:DNA-binding FadR family transcriptional regulator